MEYHIIYTVCNNQLSTNQHSTLVIQPSSTLMNIIYKHFCFDVDIPVVIDLLFLLHRLSINVWYRQCSMGYSNVLLGVDILFIKVPATMFTLGLDLVSYAWLVTVRNNFHGVVLWWNNYYLSAVPSHSTNFKCVIAPFLYCKIL